MTSPTARSLAYLRKRGYIAEVVEKFNYFTKQRKDFIGCIDILAFKGGEFGMLGVQATTREHVQERVKKCKSEFKVRDFLMARNKLEVHGWGLMGKRGKRKKYEIRIIEIK